MEVFISHWALTLLLICLIQLIHHPLQRIPQTMDNFSETKQHFKFDKNVN